MSTQKTAWMIVACCLLLFASAGLAQEEVPDSPRWYVNREIDAITDEKTVFAVLNGQVVGIVSPHFEDQSTEGATSTITIRCSDLYSLYVRIETPVLRMEPRMGILSSITLVDRDVIVRFDSEEPQTERWGSRGLSGRRDSDSDSVYLYDWHEKHQPYAFLERLATGAHQKLAVRTQYSDIVWTAIFDISEAVPVAQEVLETCPDE